MVIDVIAPRRMPSTPEIDIRKATWRDLHAIDALLARAFFADRVFEWMLPDPERRREVLPGLFEPITHAYQAHDEIWLTADARAVAVWLPPGAEAVPEAEADAFGERMARLAGVDAERVLEAFALLGENHPHEPHYYLQFLTVEPEAQGRGLGSALLEAMLTRCDREQAPAYLEATAEDNRRLYERHGFETERELTLPGGPTLYAMWREPA